MDPILGFQTAATTLLTHGNNLQQQLTAQLAKFPDLPFGLNDIAQGKLPETLSDLSAVAVVATRDAYGALGKMTKKIAHDAADDFGRNVLSFVSSLGVFVQELHPIDQRHVFRVTNENVSQGFLTDLMAAERVKGFSGWDDLQNRLGTTTPNRAVYALRDRYQDGALISIQTALTQGLGDNIGRVIRAEDKVVGQPDTATFYSISNWERVSLPLGKPFIIQVALEVQKDFPQIEHFGTLSPMYGQRSNFRKWVEQVPAETVHEIGATRVMKHSIDDIRTVALSAKSHEQLQESRVYSDLTRLAGFYIVSGTKQGGRFTPFDEVANFHPKNGARFERLLPGGDDSSEGFEKSLGFMANYQYRLDSLDANAALFQKGQMARSPDVQRILSGAPINPLRLARPQPL